MNKCRDFMGCINFDTLFHNKDVKIEDVKKRIKKIYYNDDIYYYKIIYNVSNLYNELIAYELSKDFGIPCVEYDIASYNETMGVFSKSFIGRTDKFYTFEDILEKYYGIFPIKYNSLENIYHALSLRYNDTNLVNFLMREVVLVFLFDILIANNDRHVCNYGIIENDRGISLGPLFDNESILSDICIEYGGYALSVYEKDFFTSVTELIDKDNFLCRFLKVSDEEHIKLFQEKNYIIGEENLNKVFSRIEEKIDSFIPPLIKKEKIKKFNENKFMIDNTLSKYR